MGETYAGNGIIERLVPGVNRKYGDHSAVLRQHILRYKLAAAYVRPGDLVLDAGCGSGYGSHILASVGAMVTGVDQSREAISYARKTYNHRGIAWHCSTLEAFRSRRLFHRIICLETLEHVNHPDVVLCKFYRLLRMDGVLICSVPIVPSVHYDPHHRHDFAVGDILGLLAASRFTVLDLYFQESTYLTAVVFKSRKYDLEPNPILSPEEFISR